MTADLELFLRGVGWWTRNQRTTTHTVGALGATPSVNEHRHMFERYDAAGDRWACRCGESRSRFDYLILSGCLTPPLSCRVEG